MKFGPLGIWEILLILVVILLIFGPRRLPEMAKGIGQSVREFRKGIRDMKDDIDRDDGIRFQLADRDRARHFNSTRFKYLAVEYITR